MLVVFTVNINETEANLTRDVIAETGLQELAGSKFRNFIKTITSGIRPASVRSEVNGVQASGTATFASVVATNTFTVNGQAFTAVASGATANQFNVGGSDTVTAANAAAAVNASAAAAGIYTATSSGAVVTITAARPGLMGNAITLASGQGTITVSGSRLSGGTDGAQDKTHYYGSAS